MTSSAGKTELPMDKYRIPSQLLLADEPTGSLDPENRDLVLNFLLDMNKEGKTVIIVTHDAYVAQQCHLVIEL